MIFTQHQARDAVGLSVETFRHWRKVIPYLGTRAGRQARFSFGDLVVLGVLQILVDELGIRIGQFSSSSQKFFKDCNTLAWIDATDAYALVQPNPRTERPRSDRGIVPVAVSVALHDVASHLTRTSIVIPLDPIAHSLRQFLFDETGEQSSGQTWLPLPPVAVRGRRAE